MNFNLNEKVRVKLTDHGRTCLERNHVEFWAGTRRTALYAYAPPKEDADGWSEWQLWNLMHELGPHTSMGSPVPCETTIQLVEHKPWSPPPEDPLKALEYARDTMADLQAHRDMLDKALREAQNIIAEMCACHKHPEPCATMERIQKALDFDA